MLPFIAATSFLLACENDLATINNLVNPAEMPDFSGEKATMLYSDSARVKIKVDAPIIERFSESDPPRTLLEQGIKASFFGNDQQVEHMLSADWAMLDERTETWEARGNVVVEKVSGDKMMTEELFWNQNERIIYNEAYTQIFSEGTYYQCKGGIRAAQDFSWWSCASSAGEIEFEDKPAAPRDTLDGGFMLSEEAVPEPEEPESDTTD